MGQVGLKSMHSSVKLLIASAIPWLALSCLVLWRSHGLQGRIACVALAVLQLTIAAVVWRGGIIDADVQKQQPPPAPLSAAFDALKPAQGTS